MPSLSVPTSRAVGVALLALAAALAFAGVLLLLVVGWPMAGSDGPSLTELRLARLVLTAPLWTALLVGALGGLAAAAPQERMHT
jgi:hypothetical protein